MGIRLSNTALNTFHDCGKSYEFRYIKKLAGKFKGSALYFGSSIDTGINHLLFNFKDREHPDYIKNATMEFFKAWEQGKDAAYQPIDLPLNPYIIYSKNDFDEDLLSQSDWDTLRAMYPDVMTRRAEIYAAIKEKKGYWNLPEEDRVFYGYGSWLSLRKKGELFVKAYVEQIIPLIEDVVLVQKDVHLKDEAGNTIKGVVDLVIRFKEGTVINGITLSAKENIVGDNKTSSIEYEDDSVATSQQLALYRTLLNVETDLNIEKGAYFVLSKNIQKISNKTCKSCGFKSTSNHTKCNNMIPNEKGKEVRCNGEWDEKLEFKVKTKVIVDSIPDDFANVVIENFDSVVQSVEKGVFTRNFDNCFKFGNRCEFFNICRNKSMKDIVVVPERTVEKPLDKSPESMVSLKDKDSTNQKEAKATTKAKGTKRGKK